MVDHISQRDLVEEALPENNQIDRSLSALPT
jgi:hypothetical protein